MAGSLNRELCFTVVPKTAGILDRLLSLAERRTVTLAAILGVLVVFAVGIPLAAALNIWIDEAFTLHSTGAGPAYAWQQAIVFEVQPPLYFVLEAAWRAFDEESILFARVPSIAFASAAVAVIVFAAHKIAPRIHPVVIALMTALNPLVIWAAVEMRVYALAFLLGALLTWTLYLGFLIEERSSSARFCYGLVAVLGLYTQYFIGFVLLAQALTILVLRRRVLGAYLLTMVIVTAGFLPFLRIALYHVTASDQFVSHGTLLSGFHELGNAVFSFILPHDVTWSGLEKIAGFALAALLALALTLFGRPLLPELAARAVAIQWIVAVGIFALVFSVAGIPVDPAKHVIALAASSLIVAYALVSGTTRWRAVLASAAGCIYALFVATALWAQYRPPLAKTGDWKRVASTIVRDDPTTPVMVFPAEANLPLRSYLKLPTHPIPGPMPFTVDYVRATTLTAKAEVAQVVEPLGLHSKRLWLVTTTACLEGPYSNYGYNCRYLESYLQRRYRAMKVVAFKGSFATLYTRIPPLHRIGQ